jgi:hypothetical protein
MEFFMTSLSRKILLAVAINSIVFVASPEVCQKEALENFIASTVGAQKEEATKVQQILDLFDKIVEGLRDGGEDLSKIAGPFYELCSLIVKSDASDSQNIAQIKEKLKEISLLTPINKKITPFGSTTENVKNNIVSFVTLFEEIVNNPKENGFFANLNQQFVNLNQKFVNLNQQYGKQLVAATAAVVVTSLGTLISWRIVKGSKKTSGSNPIVSPTSTSSATSITPASKVERISSVTETKSEEKQPVTNTTVPAPSEPAPVVPTTNPIVSPSSETGIEAEKKPVEVSPITPVPAPTPSENVEITPVPATPSEPAPVVSTTNPIVSPSSETGIEAEEKPVEVSPITPVPAPTPSENVEITPVPATPSEPAPVVSTTNPTAELTVPSSESGVDPKPVSEAEGTEMEERPVQEPTPALPQDSTLSLSRQNAVSDLTSLLTKEQPTILKKEQTPLTIVNQDTSDSNKSRKGHRGNNWTRKKRKK